MRGKLTWCFVSVIVVVFSLVVGHGQINPTQSLLTQCQDRITNRQRCVEAELIYRPCCVDGKWQMCEVRVYYQHRRHPLPPSVYYRRLGCLITLPRPCTPASRLTCPTP